MEQFACRGNNEREGRLELVRDIGEESLLHLIQLFQFFLFDTHLIGHALFMLSAAIVSEEPPEKGTEEEGVGRVSPPCGIERRTDDDGNRAYVTIREDAACRRGANRKDISPRGEVRIV